MNKKQIVKWGCVVCAILVLGAVPTYFFHSTQGVVEQISAEMISYMGTNYFYYNPNDIFVPFVYEDTFYLSRKKMIAWTSQGAYYFDKDDTAQRFLMQDGGLLFNGVVYCKEENGPPEEWHGMVQAIHCLRFLDEKIENPDQINTLLYAIEETIQGEEVKCTSDQITQQIPVFGDSDQYAGYYRVTVFLLSPEGKWYLDYRGKIVACPEHVKKVWSPFLTNLNL